MFRKSPFYLYASLGLAPYLIYDMIQKKKKRTKSYKNIPQINSNININVPKGENNNIDMKKGDNLKGKYLIYNIY